MMKKAFCILLAVSMIVCLCPNQVSAAENDHKSEEINEFFLQHGATLDSVNMLSEEEKLELYNATEETPNISADEIDAFLATIGTPEETILDMDYTVKLTVYESLQTVDVSVLDFIDYNEEYALAESDLDSGQSANTRDLSDWIQFSTTVVYAGGNLNRYYIYPSFEWVAGGTVLSTDTFSFALHDLYWSVLSEQNLKVYYLDGTLRYQTAASTVGFSARSYNMSSCVSNDVTIPYKGTGCLIVRAKNTPLDNRIIFNYAQNFNVPPSLSVSFGVFSITVSGFSRQYGKEARFDV